MPEPAAVATHPFRATYLHGPAFLTGWNAERLSRPDRRHAYDIDAAPQRSQACATQAQASRQYRIS